MAYKKYTVKQGDCISSIAMNHGHFPDTIWNDPKNKELKEERKNPNILMPGDLVYVREKEEKEETCASEQRHRFKRKGVPEKLRLQLLSSGEPRADLHYNIEIDGQLMEGQTDGEGRLEHWIPPNAERGKIILDDGEEYELVLGHLAPVTEEKGVRARLVNLGYLDEEDADEDDYEESIELFQSENGLEITGEADEPTRDKLSEVYGS
jgi:hypothetical protein